MKLRFPQNPRIAPAFGIALVCGAVSLNPAFAANLAKKNPAKVAVSAPLPKLLQEVEAAYAKGKTVRADFTEVDLSSVTGVKGTKTGHFEIKQPNKVRWEESPPASNLLVSDGHTYWLYTPPFDVGEPGKLIVRRSSDMSTKLANALLAGKFSETRGMKIIASGENGFKITPKKGTAGNVREISIEIDPTAKTLKKITLDHQGGNHSEITLANVRLGEPMDEGKFKFQAPPNTDHVTE